MHRRAYSLYREVVAAIKAIRKRYITVCATGWGKDSTVALLAAFQAHKKLMDYEALVRGYTYRYKGYTDTFDLPSTQSSLIIG